MADSVDFDIICPACGSKMTKIYMKEAGVNIDICLDGCGGIFFDNRELEKFDETHEKIDEIVDAIKNKEFKKVDTSVVRKCPICEIPMTKMGAKGGVELDVCNLCGAKFLDSGELTTIRNAEQDKRDIYLEYLMEEVYHANLKDVLGKKAENLPPSSPRRQLFENIMRSYLR